MMIPVGLCLYLVLLVALFAFIAGSSCGSAVEKKAARAREALYQEASRQFEERCRAHAVPETPDIAEFMSDVAHGLYDPGPTTLLKPGESIVNAVPTAVRTDPL